MASKTLKNSDSVPHTLASSSVPLEEQIRALKDQLQYQEQEIQNLNAEIEVCKKERLICIKTAEESKLSLYDEIKTLTQENEKQLTEKHQLLSKVQTKEIENATLRKENQELSAKLFESEANLDMAIQDSEKCRSWEKEYLSLEKRHIVLNELYLRLKEDMESLQNSHTFDRNKAEFEQQEQKQIEKLNEELLSRLDAKSVEIEALRTRINELEEMMGDKDLQITELHQMLEDARINHNAVLQVKSERISSLMKTNMNLQQRILRLYREISANDNRIHDTNSDREEDFRNGENSGTNGFYMNSTDVTVSDCSQRYSDFSVNESGEAVNFNNYS